MVFLLLSSRLFLCLAESPSVGVAALSTLPCPGPLRPRSCQKEVEYLMKKRKANGADFHFASQQPTTVLVGLLLGACF
ncbi:hypothetical protein QBC45DRAFT_5422 [Copromyces sp. CBS 386.78]|nr:hypothetical protein QBC45DRAFT_5422 [Copromyces sp. CBS 386.78]